ncbi:MAG TPA: DUF86 domain-containing protein [Ktedonobacterales bacterium]|nr:DUF86 domain-containing protein [Ktedonobacterales bacterium]
MSGDESASGDMKKDAESTDETSPDSEPGSGTGKYRDPQVILDEMLESIRLIQRYIDGISYEDFAGQQLLQDAVNLRIAILGEAASHLRDEDKAQWNTIPWRIITDMRNRLIHGYFAIRLDLVWQVVTSDLPPLAAQLRAIRDTLS